MTAENTAWSIETQRVGDLEQLHHSQKMETLGQLAAGVAHDFNNLLTVIKIASEALEAGKLSSPHTPRDAVRCIRSAADHAEELTKQLLSFCRKGGVSRQLLDVNDSVAGTIKLLERLIGSDVELRTRLAPHLSPIFADASQLVQVLVNLAVNARDAMPNGGQLSITTSEIVVGSKPESDVPPGEYVVIAVSDSGHGMDDSTRRRIFEPFFTTKGPGEGTGLGLSTVHAIVEQSGAHITVDSAPGHGTTFTLYFHPQQPSSGPRAEVEAKNAADETTGLQEATVLLVEDEPDLRRVFQKILQGEGHHVLVADSGREAAAVGEAFAGQIHLLVTDVDLPHLSGRDVYDRLRRKHPALRVLYVSGYTREIVVERGLISDDASLLEKPFTLAAFLAAVRRALRN
jgi:two-component system cell cycle sensor histidine kinase/response regulator CckA